MIKSKQFILVAAAAAMLHAGVALAQDSLEGLLAEVQAARAAEQQTFQQRAAEFNASPAEQQAKMLAEAKGIDPICHAFDICLLRTANPSTRAAVHDIIRMHQPGAGR